MSLPAPVQVSPIIRMGRWTLFTIGIFYGISKHKYYKSKETEWRKIEAKNKEKRDAILAEEKRLQAEAEKEALNLLSGNYKKAPSPIPAPTSAPAPSSPTFPSAPSPVN